MNGLHALLMLTCIHQCRDADLYVTMQQVASIEREMLETVRASSQRMRATLAQPVKLPGWPEMTLGEVFELSHRGGAR